MAVVDSDEDGRPFDFWLTISAFMFIATFVVGVISNCLILGVFVLKKEFRSLPNLFFINLCIADLLVLFFCMPVTIADLLSPNVWYLGAVICRLNTFLEYLATSVSSFTVITISVERFVAIILPFQVRSLFNKKNSAVILFLIWFTGVAISVPFLRVSSYYTHPWSQCTLDFSQSDMIYVMVLHILLIFIPIIVLSVIYISIIYKLRFYRKTPEFRSTRFRGDLLSSDNKENTNNKNDRSAVERQSLRRSTPKADSISKGRSSQSSVVKSQRFKNAIKISLIGCAFFCCQVPIRAFLLWSYFTNHYSPVYINLNETDNASSTTTLVEQTSGEYSLTDMVSRVATIIYYFQCVSNSVIYNISSTKFRNAFLKLSGFKRS